MFSMLACRNIIDRILPKHQGLRFVDVYLHNLGRHILVMMALNDMFSSVTLVSQLIVFFVMILGVTADTVYCVILLGVLADTIFLCNDIKCHS